jgi:hypothetical protein
MTHVPHTQHDPILGRRAGAGYVVVKRLGSGGMGDVYLAENAALGKRVALKVLHQHLAMFLGDRFLQEARAAVVIDHPHVIDIIDLGVFPEDGRPYFLMSYLEGLELGDHVARLGGQLGFGKRLPVDLTLRLFAPVLDALAAAHDKGIVHRDLKPSNVFIKHTQRGPHPTLLDFGIAKVLEESARVVNKTQSSAVMGTPGYMAPEQARGAAVDHRADIYAVGAMLYEVVTGRMAFTGETITDIAIQQVMTRPPSPREIIPDIPEAWERIIMQCLAVEPRDRPQTVKELALRLINATENGYTIVREVASELVERAGAMDPTVRASGSVPRMIASAATPTPVPVPAPGHAPIPTPRRRRAGAMWLAGTAIGLVAALVLAVVVADDAPDSRAAIVDAGAAVTISADAAATSAGADAEVVRDPVVAIAPDAAVVATAPPDARVEVASADPAPASAESPDAAPGPVGGGAAAAPVTKPGRGKLTIKVDPWAVVTLRGPSGTRKLGQTPITGHSLDAGSYTVILKSEDRSESVAVTVEPGKHVRITRSW